MRKKVSIIGSGDVGTHAALFIAEKRLADVHLVDIVEGRSEGATLDLMEAAPLRGWDVRVEGSTDLASLAGSEVVVIAAGKVRTPWMQRADVLGENAAIVSGLVAPIIAHAPQATVIVVTEPVDAMTYLVQKKSGLPRERVVGMAGVLDSERLRYFIAEHFGVNVLDTAAMVIGGHHQFMIPLSQYCRVAGIPVTELMEEAEFERLTKRVRNANEEILNLLRTSSSCLVAAAAVAEMVETVARDLRRILSVPIVTAGEYGFSDVCLGVPALLGSAGVMRVIELQLTPAQHAALKYFADRVRSSQHALVPGA